MKKGYTLVHGDLIHGNKTAEYRAWIHIKTRCFNANCPAYGNYGGRGITMHPDWRSDYQAFLSYVGRRPTPKHTIDRIDNNRGYEPGNVRWATRAEQNSNYRRNIWIEYQGERRILLDWTTRLGLPYHTIKARIHKGWDGVRALTQPLRRLAGVRD